MTLIFDMIFFLCFLGFFKAKNNAHLGILSENNLIKIHSSGDEVFDKEQSELDVDIQNPFIKDESIEFPKAETETVIENKDYINNTDNWSIFNVAQQELGNPTGHAFNWLAYKNFNSENSFINK